MDLLRTSNLTRFSLFVSFCFVVRYRLKCFVSFVLCHPWIPKLLHWGRARRTTWKKLRLAWTRFVLVTSVILLLKLVSITAMVIIISFFFRSSQYDNFIYSFLFVIVVVIRCKSGILEQSFLLSALHSEKDSFGLQQAIWLSPHFLVFKILSMYCVYFNKVINLSLNTPWHSQSS